jgi:hypothetical protein
MAMATATTKHFIVDYGNGTGSVYVTYEHTMADVRRLMYEDWDEDMLPDQDVEWAFCWVGDSDLRISEKQEGREKAWNFIGKDVRILEGIDKNCNKKCNKNKKRSAADAAASNSTINNNKNNSTNKNKRQKRVSHAQAAELARQELLESNCKPEDVWNLLKKLGCHHSGGYRLPEGNERFANLQDLAQHILENSIIDLNPHDKLTRAELQTLHRWLKFKNLSLNSSTPVYEALECITNRNIVQILEKLEFQCDDNGNYRFKNVTLGLEGIVNLVRRTEDMCSIGGPNMLTEMEELTLRLWAAEKSVPLVFFDEEDFCSENHGMDENDDCSAGD